MDPFYLTLSPTHGVFSRPQCYNSDIYFHQIPGKYFSKPNDVRSYICLRLDFVSAYVSIIKIKHMFLYVGPLIFGKEGVAVVSPA